MNDGSGHDTVRIDKENPPQTIWFIVHFQQHRNIIRSVGADLPWRRTELSKTDHQKGSEEVNNTIVVKYAASRQPTKEDRDMELTVR
jgi:hypothetical protein